MTCDQAPMMKAAVDGKDRRQHGMDMRPRQESSADFGHVLAMSSVVDHPAGPKADRGPCEAPGSRQRCSASMPRIERPRPFLKQRHETFSAEFMPCCPASVSRRRQIGPGRHDQRAIGPRTGAPNSRRGPLRGRSALMTRRWGSVCRRRRWDETRCSGSWVGEFANLEIDGASSFLRIAGSVAGRPLRLHRHVPAVRLPALADSLGTVPIGRGPTPRWEAGPPLGSAADLLVEPLRHVARPQPPPVPRRRAGRPPPRTLRRPSSPSHFTGRYCHYLYIIADERDQRRPGRSRLRRPAW